MKTRLRWQCLSLAGLGLALGTLTGCQTWVGGMTLPSGHYLQHPPQYFAPSPPFPLSNELATMEAEEGAVPGGPGAQLPPPAAAPVQAPPPAPVPLPAPAPGR